MSSGASSGAIVSSPSSGFAGLKWIPIADSLQTVITLRVGSHLTLEASSALCDMPKNCATADSSIGPLGALIASAAIPSCAARQSATFSSAMSSGGFVCC